MVLPIDEEPQVSLWKWGFLHDPYGYRLVGMRDGINSPRVSSPVEAYDSRMKTVMTESGRLYHLIGEFDPDTTEKIVKGHMKRFGLGVWQVTLATPSEVEERLVQPRPKFSI